MRVVHPVADEWTDEYAVYSASSRRVLLSEPLKLFLDSCVEDGLRPVLVTDSDAELSPLVATAMARSAGFWAVLDASGGVFNALTGYQISGFHELWAQPDTSRTQLPALRQTSPEPLAALQFETFAFQRARAQTLTGELGTHMVSQLGGQGFDVWDRYEPLMQPWNVAAVTEFARRGMPDSQAAHARALDGSYASMQVTRTRRGLLEEAKGAVPLSAYPGDTSEVMAAASAALTSAAQQFLLTVGFVSLSETGPNGTQTATAKRPEVPLAVALGPKTLHDLDVDVESITRQYDATVIGRRRVASLVVRFSRPDEGLWWQMMRFVRELGEEKVAEALGVRGD